MNTTPDNEITINVVGHAGMGKSTVQILIADILRSYGFNVNVDTHPDFLDENQLRNTSDVYDETRLDNLRKKISQINIKEVQASRYNVYRSYQSNFGTAFKSPF